MCQKYKLKKLVSKEPILGFYGIHCVEESRQLHKCNKRSKSTALCAAAAASAREAATTVVVLCFRVQKQRMSHQERKPLIEIKRWITIHFKNVTIWRDENIYMCYNCYISSFFINYVYLHTKRWEKENMFSL